MLTIEANGRTGETETRRRGDAETRRAASADAQRLSEALCLICRDNGAALRYLQLLARAARLMDDLVDNDHGPVDHGELFHLLLVELPLDPFFQAHRQWLLPAYVVALNAWQDANVWEKSGHAKAPRREDEAAPSPLCASAPLREIYAHVLRDTLTEVGLLVAFLVGGREHQRAVSLPVRELFLKPLEPATGNFQP